MASHTPQMQQWPLYVKFLFGWYIAILLFAVVPSVAVITWFACQGDYLD